MISKINTSTSIAKTLGYCMNKPDRFEVIKAHGVWGDKHAMIKQMELQTLLNPRVKKTVLHILLSHHPDDTQKIRGREIEILNSWFSEMRRQKNFDLKMTQYVVVKHIDRNHLHYHVLANMVSNSGRRLNIDYLGLKGKEVSKEVTKKFGLTPAVKRKYQSHVIAHGYQVTKGIESAMRSFIKINKPSSFEDNDLIFRIRKNKNNELSIS